jgi:hypothetical protein
MKNPFAKSFTSSIPKINSHYASIVCALALTFAFAAAGVEALLQPTNSPSSAPPTSAPETSSAQVVERGPNYNLWTKVTLTNDNGFGVVERITNSFRELASGLNHLDSNGMWVASVPVIHIQQSGGAIADGAPHTVYLPGDLYSEAFELKMANGQVLKTRPVGLSLSDGRKNIFINELKPSFQGQIQPDGLTAIYKDVCAGPGPLLDIQVRYRKGAWEDDLVIREQLGDPAQYDPEFTDTRGLRLQWWTEILSGPEPKIQAIEQKGALMDTVWDFGPMRMVRSKGFLIGDEKNESSFLVSKYYVVQDNRRFIVEEVKLDRISAKLNKLPARVAVLPSRKPSRKIAKGPGVPPPRPLRKSSRQLELARASVAAPGILIDYTLVSTTTNFVAGPADTWYVSDYFYLSGNTTLYGGATFKFAPYSGIYLEGTVDCFTGPFKPITFTAVDDDKVGESVDGSTGNPSGWYGTMLDVSGITNELRYLNFRYAGVGIQSFEPIGPLTFSHVQFIKCAIPFQFLYGNTVTIQNALLATNDTAFTVSEGVNVNASHLTIDKCSSQLVNDIDVQDSVLNLTNTILTGITDFGNLSTFNTDHVLTNASPSSIFQKVSGGSYYLANNSAIDGATNISAGLRADFAHMTVYPPLIYSNIAFNVDTVFNPVINRDGGLIPAIGYHYPAVDFLFIRCRANAALTFSPGTASAWDENSVLGVGGPTNGISLADAQTCTFTGRADAPAFWASLDTFQEKGQAPSQPGIGSTAWPNASSAPTVLATFAHFCVMGARYHFYQSKWLNMALGHCELNGGLVVFPYRGLTATNCLFCATVLRGNTTDSSSVFSLENSTVWHGEAGVNRTSAGTNSLASLRGCVFDLTWFYTGQGAPGATYCDYNAHSPFWVATNSNDQILSNFNWQTSALGNFYLPSDSPLVDAGAVAASTVGLYHFTTQTNQSKETTSQVDLGYHYVAVDGSGIPLDSDTDGIPDFLEDINGNGVVDSGETDWQIAFDLGLKVKITRPTSNSIIP